MTNPDIRSERFVFVSHSILAGRRLQRGGIDMGKVVLALCLERDVNIVQMLGPPRGPPLFRANHAADYARKILDAGKEVCAIVLWLERRAFRSHLWSSMKRAGIPRRFLTITERNLYDTEPALREMLADSENPAFSMNR